MLEFLAAVEAKDIANAVEASGLVPGPVRPLDFVDAGFESFVYRSASGWIFRVARTPAAATRHDREIGALPQLSARLPVAVPLPLRLIGGAEGAPYGVTAYRALPGRMMRRDDLEVGAGRALAPNLAEALAALHATPRDVVPGIPSLQSRHFKRLRDTTLPALRARLERHEVERLTAWWEMFLRSEAASWEECAVTHGDPWRENLLVEDGRLAGIVDWEYMCFRDPANDLGVTLTMGEGFFGEVLRAYQEFSGRRDRTLEQRARLLAAVREFYGVRYALEREDEGEWVDSLAALRAGPILG